MSTRDIDGMTDVGASLPDPMPRTDVPIRNGRLQLRPDVIVDHSRPHGLPLPLADNMPSYV